MSNRRKRRRSAGSALPPGSSFPVPVALRESAVAVAERVAFAESNAGSLVSAGGRRYRARLIEGDRWGSSGFWPRAVLERDGPKAWPADTTLMYLDHPSATEAVERPERSVRDLAARVVSTPVYEGDGLYADIEVFPHAVPLVEALADTIGLSVRGDGSGTVGKVGDRSGVIIESIDRGYSVDFVTKAGAGGKLVSLLEAARTLSAATTEALRPLRQMAATARLREATTEDIRQALRDALGDKYGTGPDDGPGWLWVRDYDAARGLVWFDTDDDGESTTFQQGYTVTNADPPEVALTGDRIEVIARTTYEPAPTEDEAQTTDATVGESARPPVNTDVTDGTPPAETNPPEEESSVSGSHSTGLAPGAAGTTEATVQVSAAVTEAETARARAEQERDTALQEAAQMRQSLARLTATEAARPIAAGILAESALPPAGRDRVLNAAVRDVPLTEADELRNGAVVKVLRLDEAAFRTAVTEAAKAEETYVASLREAAGEGRVTGLGAAATTPDTAKQFETDLAESFKRLGMSSDAALVAAGGRG